MQSNKARPNGPTARGPGLALGHDEPGDAGAAQAIGVRRDEGLRDRHRGLAGDGQVCV